MKWPNASDYAAAIQNPHLNFADLQLRNSKPELNQIGIPKARTGAFATVFRMITGKSNFAARCFLKHFEDQQQRYAEISHYLDSVRLSCTTGFVFLQQGIRIYGQWYPLLKMDWINGTPIGTCIRQNHTNQRAMFDLSAEFLKLIADLKLARIAHGDLQNGNLMVSDHKLILIDYDGMFVPSFRGRKSHELGQRNFQHPERNETHFDESLDNFSAWVIYISLFAIATDPNLWALTGADKNDEQLLFTKRDFENPHNSEVFRLLLSHKNEQLRTLASRFQTIAANGIHKVPCLMDDVTGLTPASGPASQLPTWIKDLRGNFQTITNTTPLSPALQEQSPPNNNNNSTSRSPSPNKSPSDDLWDTWVAAVKQPKSAAPAPSPPKRTPGDDLWDSWIAPKINNTQAQYDCPLCSAPLLGSTTSANQWTCSKYPNGHPSANTAPPKQLPQQVTTTIKCPLCASPLLQVTGKWQCSKYPNGHP